MILVKWTYTTEEWKRFIRVSGTSNNFFTKIRQHVSSMAIRSAPVVSITADKVWIGEEQQYFSSGRHELHHVDILNEGTVNMLSFSFVRNGTTSKIRVPVPKGKLREAIAVQDRLMPASTY